MSELTPELLVILMTLGFVIGLIIGSKEGN